MFTSQRQNSGKRACGLKSSFKRLEINHGRNRGRPTVTTGDQKRGTFWSLGNKRCIVTSQSGASTRARSTLLLHLSPTLDSLGHFIPTLVAMSPFRALLLVALIALAVGFQPRSHRLGSALQTSNIRSHSQLFLTPQDSEPMESDPHTHNLAHDAISLLTPTALSISLLTLTYLPLMASAAAADIAPVATVSPELAVLFIMRPVFDNLVNLLSFFFICRTVFSWYPKTDLNKFPYSVAGRCHVIELRLFIYIPWTKSGLLTLFTYTLTGLFAIRV
jgi:hypothetical protein